MYIDIDIDMVSNKSLPFKLFLCCCCFFCFFSVVVVLKTFWGAWWAPYFFSFWVSEFIRIIIIHTHTNERTHSQRIKRICTYTNKRKNARILAVFWILWGRRDTNKKRYKLENDVLTDWVFSPGDAFVWFFVFFFVFFCLCGGDLRCAATSVE